MAVPDDAAPAEDPTSGTPDQPSITDLARTILDADNPPAPAPHRPAVRVLTETQRRRRRRTNTVLQLLTWSSFAGAAVLGTVAYLEYENLTPQWMYTQPQAAAVRNAILDNADAAADHLDAFLISRGWHDNLPDSLRLTAKPMPTDLVGKRYTFMYQNGDTISHWATCAPIRVRLSSHRLPEGAEDVLHTTLDHLRARTGMQFRYDGQVRAVPTQDWATRTYHAYQDSRTGTILIAFATEHDTDLYTDRNGDSDAHTVAGKAVTRINPTNGHLGSAGIVLNPAKVNLGNLDGILLHELGHAIGLGHSGIADAIMAPQVPRGAFTFNDDDQAGIDRLRQARTHCEDVRADDADELDVQISGHLHPPAGRQGRR